MSNYFSKQITPQAQTSGTWYTDIVKHHQDVKSSFIIY